MSIIERPDMDDLAELAYPYALDAVSAAERDDIDHRRERADRVTAAEFDAGVSAVREAMAELSVLDACPPPAEAEDRLMRALDRMLRAARDQSGYLARAPRPVKPQPSDKRRWGLGPFTGIDTVAAVLLLVVLGTGLVFVVQRTDDRPAIDALSSSLIDRQPDVTTRVVRVSGGGELEIQASAALSAASIRFLAVPPPPAGHAYQIWLVQMGGEPRSAAVLPELTETPVVTAFRPTDTLAVTLEPAAGSPQPTTEPVASINLLT
ncbi:anti-sigma factor domain-containing protein [Nocardia sp. NPDC057668]|uniref:anti-sigma factor n=1 Tax=Nocardia sp. NPDC057668 TaxID=3346202 RepID=UPI00366C7A7C